jgi:hypothetical protein
MMQTKPPAFSATILLLARRLRTKWLVSLMKASSILGSNWFFLSRELKLAGHIVVVDEFSHDAFGVLKAQRSLQINGPLFERPVKAPPFAIGLGTLPNRLGLRAGAALDGSTLK